MTKTALDLSLEALELPSSAYEKAVSRYEDLGAFLSSDSSIIALYEPQIFVQGSFRLGTAIKPLMPTEPYDLDLTCELTRGISKQFITQKDFKDIVGDSLDQYVSKRNIQEAKIEKRRCWRIVYQDSIDFHMDVVPGILIEDTSSLRESMIKSNISAETASEWATLAYNITDNKRPDYSVITLDWNITNPEGYAKWFEQRMEAGKIISLMEKAHYEKIKVFERKTVLQRCVQILKRHRDVMFQHGSDLKPISIIITTLAGRAYNGELTLEDALTNIIFKMGGLVNKNGVRVPNPTRPEEDFADKWKENPNLELAFNRWLMQAQADFGNIAGGKDLQTVISKANNSFGVRLNESMFGIPFTNKNVNIIPNRIEIDAVPPKPHMWK
jgi:hypothetical protein